jgi:serine/threonine-protein kinase
MVDRGTVIGGYRVEGLLGRGGMGEVFRASDVESGRVVALKLMADGVGPDPRRDARFRGEGRVQASLDHPHVVTVYDAGESEHGLYLAMRLIDGPTLADLIRERRLDARHALDLLDQVADALDAAHDEGIVHRDVKPHNVLIAEGDHAFLADFGLTRAGAEPSLTASGALVGTVAYLSPEVVRGGEATAASDLYAFAAMTFECLTGTTIFPRTSGASVLFAHANDPPPRISARRQELGAALDAVFERALSKEPSERAASAREFVADVRREMETSGTDELPPPPAARNAALGRTGPTADSIVPASLPGPAPAPARRRTIALVALAALVGAAIVAVAWLAVGGQDDEAAAPVAADRPGLEYVGSPLEGPAGRALDCRGRPPGPSSPACTVVQSALPDQTVVVPRNGVIRQWQVRGARGELTLAITRPREGGSFQVATSDTEVVGSADVQSFDTEIDVERGDRIGLIVPPGSAVGTREGDRGTATDRWLPQLAGVGRPADRKAGTGFDRELLLRVGIAPGAKRLQPAQVKGAAAADLPAGDVLRRTSAPLGDETIRLELVRRGRDFSVDKLEGGRRTASIAVPKMRPGAHVIRWLAAAWDPQTTGIDLWFYNEGSGRIVQTGYVVTPDGFLSLR